MSDVQADLGNTPAEGQVEAGAEVSAESEAPKAPDTSWVPKRISEITAARRAAEDRAARAEAELAAFRANGGAAQGQGEHAGTHQGQDQSVEALAKAYAERMVREQQSTSSMNERIKSINEAGAKEFGDDYEKSVQNLQMAGIGGPDFLKALTKIEGAEKLVTFLGKTENLNDAMRIGTLDPVEMAIELTKMSTKANKALSKQVSKAPPPATTISGGGGGDGGEPDPSDTAAWMKWRSSNRKSRR
jgi:hypothetical protein